MMLKDSLYDVKTTRNVLIKMRDGVSLAADLYQPSSDEQFPALVVYIPYHKDSAFGGFFMNSFAQRGYAGLLVDIRGTGSSEGRTDRPMSKLEQTDGYDVIEWTARQGWCDGNVGMWGISYSGFTSLQVAALAPPHLKAIASIDADLDEYSGFAYPGGCLNCLQACGGWGPFMLVMNSMSPLYFDDQGRWEKVWAQHLKNNEPWLLHWLSHPLWDDYWKETSTLETVEAIRAPVLAIGGWRDIFPTCALRLFERLRTPKKIIVGPWTHGYPDRAVPGPQIDYFEVLRRWWDYWLKGDKNGIMDEKPGAFYVQELNKWVSLQEPPPHQQGTALFLSERKLDTEPASKATSLTCSVDNTVGLEAGLWSPFDLDVGLPLEQCYDDSHSLTFDSSSYPDGLRIFGIPRLKLSCSFSAPRGQLVAKMVDVSPGGRSTLITTGWHNMNHDAKHEEYQTLQIGRVYDVSMDLCGTSYFLGVGHRLRLAISGSDFPRIWPCPHNFDITVHQKIQDTASLFIPTVTHFEDFPHITRVYGPGYQDPRTSWQIIHDPAGSTCAFDVEIHRRQALEPGSTIYLDHKYRAKTTRGSPSLTAVTSSVESRYKSIDKCIIVRGKTRVSSDTADLNLYVEFDGTPYHSKAWHLDGVPNLKSA